MLKIILFLISLLSLTQCQRTDKAQEKAPLKDTRFLKLSFASELRSLDPRIGIDNPSCFVLRMLFEGLMHIGTDGKLSPGAAQSYEISEDQKTYTFHLRPTKWSNGEDVTAYDFEYTWKKIIDPNSITEGAHNFYIIKNAREVVQNKASINDLGIHAVDARTLVVELENPTPYFLEALATSSFFPVNSNLDKRDPSWTTKQGSEFVCNGPFLLESQKLENEITVLKNPAYWNSKQVQLPGIKIAIVKDAMTQLQMFEKNDIDWIGKPISNLPLDAIASMKKKNQILSFPAFTVYWFFLNTQKAPFTNKKMRKAFAYAINRKVIEEHILQEGGLSAMGVLPHNLNAKGSPFFADHCVDLARKLFNEALEELHMSKESLSEITISTANVEINTRIAQVLQQQWQEAFGIHVKIVGNDWKVHFDKVKTGDFTIGGMKWQSRLRDPIYIMQTFRYADDSINMSRWENPRYQALLDASEKELSKEKRSDIFYEAEALLMDEMPVIPIYFYRLVYAKKNTLKNVYLSEVEDIDFRWAYFSDDSP